MQEWVPGRGTTLSRTSKRLLRYMSPSILAAMLVGVVSAVALFIPPYVGMADNGDFSRIIYGNGLYFNAPDYIDQYFGYFIRQYGIMQYYNEYSEALFSSQSLFIRLSLWINRLFVSDVIFDIRVQAGVLWVLLVAAVYLLVEGLTWRTPNKLGYPIAFLAVFIFGDTGYTAYLNSFYGESIVLLMSLFVVSSLLLLCRKRFNDYVLLAILATAMLLLTTSKQQNAPVGIIAGTAGWVIVFANKSRTYRSIVCGMLVMFIVAGAATYALIPQQFVHINQYHAMTRGALLVSDNPEETLRHFGIDRQYALLAGSNYYERYTTVDVDAPLLENTFYDRYGFTSLVGYYLAHPGQTIKLLHLSARHAFTIRPPAMGNFERAEDRPFGAHTSFFSAYSTYKEAVAPRTFGFILLWMAIIIGFYFPSFLRAYKAKAWRQAIKLPLLVMFILIGLSGIAVSLIGAGDADLSKHQFLFTVMFDIVSFVAVSDLIMSWYWRSVRRAGRGALT
ncbi:glycan biosynthesis hexose transferase WsfD [Paenibacillus sp. strain BS8-2]